MIPRTTTLFLLTICLTSFAPNRSFPKLDHQTISGEKITNDFFQGKKTLVVSAHLGCPPAMILFKDLDAFVQNTGFQVLVILENTHQQVIDYNASEENSWSDLRKMFKLEPLAYPTIAECETENITMDGDNMIVDIQCRKLSKKLWTRSSPTLVFVDESGKIYHKFKGYYAFPEQEKRLEKLMEMR